VVGFIVVGCCEDEGLLGGVTGVGAGVITLEVCGEAVDVVGGDAVPVVGGDAAVDWSGVDEAVL
jgi:hypothetical protein